MIHHEAPFFEREPFDNLIAELSKEHSHITFVAGAGLTIPEGRPTWRSLVWNLLQDRYERENVRREDEAASRFATALIKASDVISAATIATAGLTDDELGVLIRKWLYEQDRAIGTMSTSQFVRSVLGAAEADWALGRDVMILTTNYDDSFVRSSNDHALVTAKLRTLADLEALEKFTAEKDEALEGDEVGTASEEIPVVHLHGSVPLTGEFGGKVILDERSYADGGREVSWQAQLFRERLIAGPVVFVGMSMSDPNLTRYLLWTGQERSDRFVLMSQEDFQWHQAGSPDEAEAVLKEFDSGVRDRFEQLGLTLVLVDHYRQIPQTLNEVSLALMASAAGSDYHQSGGHYEQRLLRWIEGMDWLKDAEPDRWERAQAVLSAELSKLRDDIASEYEVDPGELRVDLWLRSTRDLMRVGSSEVRWTSLASARRDPIDHDAPQLPVMRAFCNGVGLMAGNSGSRWKSSLSLPITLSDTPEFDLLPVGVLDIRSSSEESDSPLRELTMARSDELRADFLRRATQLAVPREIKTLIDAADPSSGQCP